MLAIASRDWEFPLFVHVLGAMLLVGALLTVGVAYVLAWRRTDAGAATLTRFGFWTLLVAALPAFVVMRVGAQWVESDSPFDDEADWIGVGYVVSDLGLIVMLIATVLAGFAARRARRAESGGGVLGRIAGVLAIVLVLAYLVAMWAMTTKPS